MRPCLTIVLLVSSFMPDSAFASPQRAATNANPPAGSIAGSVRIAGKPAPHITVVLLLDNHDLPVVARTVTDEAGHFKFANESSGRYLLRVIAPTWAPTEVVSPDSEGKPVSLKDGEELEGVDLPCVRGGVITGRITGKDGLPVTGESIQLCPVTDSASIQPCRANQSLEFETDDRGIYRIYGIPPGRYTLSAGKDRADMGGVDFQGRGNYVRTFYPSTTDQNNAVPVEVTSGGESSGIDITLGKPVTAYTVTGRIINADTGHAYVPFGPHARGEVEVFEGPPFADTPFRHLFGVSDDKGKFEIIGGLVPGKYAAAVIVESDSPDTYGELTPFEVTDHDVTGLELKVRRASTVSGVVVANSQEGGVTPQVFQRLRILAHATNDGAGSLPAALSAQERSSNVAADGSFLIHGLRPGRLSLGFAAFGNDPGVWILRIEGPGAIQHDRDISVPVGYQYPDAVEIPTGASLSGLRIVVALGSATIQGQVRIVGGELPGGLTVYVLYRRLDAPSSEPYHAFVEMDGQFKIQNLPAGTYVLETSVEPGGQSPGTVLQNIRQASTTLTVADGDKSEVTLLIDLNQKNNRADR